MRTPPSSLALPLFVAAAGLASLALGQDANWDLLNYHRYNPWAWLAGRYGHDVAPALQSFHNPLADLPFHAMVEAGWPPRVIAFVLAVPAGVAAYFVFRLARLAFADLPPALARACVAAAVAIGVTGPNARALLGTTMNEWHVAALLVPAAYLVARDVHAGAMRRGTLVAAGLLAGAASGIKLTAAPYALALAMAVWVARGGRRGGGEAFAFAVAALAGLAVTLGPWMVELGTLTGNPLFPYFNAVFRSPWLPADWRFEQDFGPRHLGQWLTLPFDLLRPPRGYVSEQRYRDARFPLLAALAIALPVVRLVPRPRPAPPTAGTRALVRLATTFFLAAFALWAALFSIHRYLLTLEAASGIALVALVVALAPARHRVAAVVAVAVLVVATTRAPTWWRVPFGEAFVRVDVPAVPPRSLVLIAGGPLTFAAPAFPADARFAGIDNGLVDERDSGLRRAIAALAAAEAPRFVLAYRSHDASRALASFGLRVAGPCAEVRSNLARAAIDLCPLAPAQPGSGKPPAAR